MAQLIQAQQEEEGKFEVQTLALEFMAAGKLMLGAADWPEMGRSGKKLSKSLSNERGIFQEKIVAARNGLVKRGKCKN